VTVSGYYQIAEDQQPAGYGLVDSELIDFTTGDTLIDLDDGLPLTGDTQETVISASGAFPVALMNSAAIPVEVVNQSVSEVEIGLLGVPRAETALGILGLVNTYGLDLTLWGLAPGGLSLYQYFRDPNTWTFQVKDGIEYGWFARHLPKEAALQVYALPPEKSYEYLEDDGTGRYPGGYTDGVITNYIESKRTFRYQPGRITGVTMGVRMSTDSNWPGESISWGCRNSYGDGYYFRLDKGTDLYVVRESPGLPTLVVPREQWNGDPVTVEAGDTGWNLDVSKVTMFKIEFGWYGAIGATLFAYVPIDHDNARWVKLHSFRAENQNTVPSLRSPYLRIFIQATQTAGASTPAFVNLYGSSVYIDGGDDGTLQTASASTPTAATITNQARSIIGLLPATRINDIPNQKTLFPTSLSFSSDLPARLDLMVVNPGIGNSESYGYGHGTTISRPAASGFAVVRTNATTLTGVIPTGLPFTPATAHGYLYSGYPVKVVASGLNNYFATTLNATTIGTNRNVPAGTTSVALAAFDAYAIGNNAEIVSGDGVDLGGSRQYTGKLYFTRPSGNTGGIYWRLGLWLNASGTYLPGVSTVSWLATAFPGIDYTLSGEEIGEVALPPETFRQVSFSIVESGGVATVRGRLFRQLAASPPPVTITGSPFPIKVVAELYPGSSLSDVVLSMAAMPDGYLGLAGEDFANAYDRFAVVPGSGRTLAISGWTTSGNITQSAVGGANYVANKFETPLNLPLTGALVDLQGRRTPYSLSSIASFFAASGESRTVPLSAYFGPDKTFLAGGADTPYGLGALFVVASARVSGQTGNVFASINWSEQ
jgi:hypothetical protein